MKWKIGLAMLAGFLLLSAYALWLVHKSTRKAEAAAAWVRSCRSVRLTDTREELIQRMGPPLKEAVVADGRTVMMYPHWAVSDKYPRFYLDPKRGRIDHIVCSPGQTVKMTPELWQQWDAYQAYLDSKERFSESRAILGSGPVSP